MQTSFTLNEVHWFANGGDVDSCGYISALQCAWAVAPWVFLESEKALRAAAGDPDDGIRDGTTLAEIKAAAEGCYPAFKGKCAVLSRVTWSRFVTEAKDNHPMSVSLMASKLPTRLRHGFAGAHQCSLVVKADGRVLWADPLADASYSRWTEIAFDDVRPAILAHGNGAVNAVRFPTEAEMFPSHPLFAEATRDAIAAATVAFVAENGQLRQRITAAQQALGGQA